MEEEGVSEVQMTSAIGWRKRRHKVQGRLFLKRFSKRCRVFMGGRRRSSKLYSDSTGQPDVNDHNRTQPIYKTL